MALDDAGPIATDTTADPVFRAMHAEETGSSGVVTTLLMIGGALTLVTVAVATAVTFALLYGWFGTSWIGLPGWFVVVALLLVPYVVYLERRTRGKTYADAILTVGNYAVPDADSTVLPAATASSFGGQFTALGHKILAGPRLLLGGLQRLNRCEAVHYEAFLLRSANLVLQLAISGQPMQMHRLAQRGEVPAALDRVLDHLDGRDWIGKSSDETRVWLSGKAKEKLVKIGVPLGVADA